MSLVKMVLIECKTRTPRLHSTIPRPCSRDNISCSLRTNLLSRTLVVVVEVVAEEVRSSWWWREGGGVDDIETKDIFSVKDDKNEAVDLSVVSCQS